MVQVTYHHDLAQVQRDARLAHLLSEAVQHSPFDRLAWWQGLVHYCGLLPFFVVAHDTDGYAVLPLRCDPARPDHLFALANWYTFRFRPVFTDPALLAAACQGALAQAHRLTLDNVPEEDGSLAALIKALHRPGWWIARSVCDTNHVLTLAGRTYADYLRDRPGKLRTTLKRKSGKVRTQVLTHFDAGAWDAYESIYAQSWKGKEGSPAFLRAFAEAEGAAGRLRLGLAWDASHPDRPAIAAQMWTIEGKCAFIHKLAHRENARTLSPGTVLSAAHFAHAIDVDHVEMIDFGTGDDPYKRDWMEAQRPRYRMDCIKLTDPRNASALLRAFVRTLAARLKRG